MNLFYNILLHLSFSRRFDFIVIVRIWLVTNFNIDIDRLLDIKRFIP